MSPNSKIKLIIPKTMATLETSLRSLEIRGFSVVLAGVVESVVLWLLDVDFDELVLVESEFPVVVVCRFRVESD